jgi:hypothetical protein
MGNYTTKNNTGSFFKNDRQREGKNDPDYTGSAVVDDRAYWVDVWVKNNPRKPNYDPQKKTFFSTSFRLKDEQGGQPEQRQAAPPPETRHAPPPPPPRRTATKPPADDTASDADIPF